LLLSPPTSAGFGVAFNEAKSAGRNFSNLGSGDQLELGGILRRYLARSAHAISSAMIHLTRLNNSTLTVNADPIKFVEQSPATVITLVNGQQILVQEPVSEIVARIVEFRRRLLTGTGAWNHTPSLVFPKPLVSSTDESEG